MSQKNGLPDSVKRFDNASTHNFADNSTWSASGDSTWTLQPPSGEAYKLNKVELFVSKSAVQHNGGDFLVEFFANNLESPLLTRSYKDRKDWVRRSTSEIKELPVVDGGVVYSENILQFTIEFDQKPVLWSSSDWNSGNPVVDNESNVKVGKMDLRINDDTPYKKSDALTSIDAVEARYYYEVYEDE